MLTHITNYAAPAETEKEFRKNVVPRGCRQTGLRREELATLAGISSDYYLRLEQGPDHQRDLGALTRSIALGEGCYCFNQGIP